MVRVNAFATVMRAPLGTRRSVGTEMWRLAKSSPNRSANCCLCCRCSCCCRAVSTHVIPIYAFWRLERLVLTEGKHSFTRFPNTASTKGTVPLSSQNSVYLSHIRDLCMAVEGSSETMKVSSSQFVAAELASEELDGDADFLLGRGAVTAR